MTDRHDFVAFRQHTQVRERRRSARTTTGDPAMTERRIVESDITDDGVERRETLRKDYVSGAPHGDEEAGGAVSGATAGAIDQKDKDDTVVVTREERPL